MTNRWNSSCLSNFYLHQGGYILACVGLLISLSARLHKNSLADFHKTRPRIDPVSFLAIFVKFSGNDAWILTKINRHISVACIYEHNFMCILIKI